MQALAQEVPLTVKEAARFLGVSPQTVYAWVERRQIPHLRVMGRNIQFLRSELSAFRANVSTGGGEWHDRKSMTASCTGAAVSGGCGTGIETAPGASNPQRQVTGRKPKHGYVNDCRARDENVLAMVRRGQQLRFHEWADFFLEHYSQPPLRSMKTHAANQNAVKQLKPVFGPQMLSAIGAEDVEGYLRWRLRQQKRVRTRLGYRELGLLKPATVHQEFRVLRRVLNVRGEEEVHRGQPLQLSGVPGHGQGVVSAALHAVVGTAADRVARTSVLAEPDPDHHRNRITGLQGACTDAERPGRPGKRSGLDT